MFQLCFSFKRIFTVFTYLLLFTSVTKAQVTSDFSTNDDGWTILDNSSGASSSPTYNSTGGNPNGYISYSTTTNNASTLYFRAPSKFLGNQSIAYNQNLTFDLKVSTAGTDNNSGDVIINSASYGSIVYQLPTKPSNSSWSSYSVSLNEANWHSGCPTCAAPSRNQMKMILSNITYFQIRLKYFVSTGGTYVSQLDNVVMNTVKVTSAPTITSFTPQAALAGATVTITGTNFNATSSQNIVYFNGIKGVVTNATSTQLTVTVPTSAAFGPISVVNLATGQQGSSIQSFNPLFDNNKDYGGRIIPASLGRGYNVILPMSSTASNSFGSIDKGDIDGDGWMDVVTTETSTSKIYVFRNLGTGGSVAISSFSTGIALPSLSGIPGSGPSLAEVLVADVDNDGKPDVVASVASNFGNVGYLTVFRNSSTSGSVSFDNPLYFAYNYYSSLTMAAGDLDLDGRVDFALTTGTSPGNIFICQNLSTPGNIDFSFGGNISSTSTSGLSDIVIGDLTGDGKPEIVCPGYNAATLSIYKNNSTPGLISMAAAFTIPASVSYTNRLVMADFDADNRLDMAWSTYGAQYVYFTKNNYSGGTFDATSFGATIQVANTVSNPGGITAGDINGDGKPEVILSGYNDLAVLENVGAAGNLSASSFLPTTLFQGTASSSIFGLNPVVADLDGDNKPEAFFASGNGSPTGATGIYVFHNESFPTPAISSVSPSSALIGTNVTLNGKNMFTGNVTPSARLSKLTSTVNGAATNTATSVTTPSGSVSGKFALTNHGLTAVSPYFNMTFGTTRVINSTSFGPSVDFALATGTRDALEIADFDDDGKPDVVAIDNSFTCKIFQNIATAGQSISTSSLALQTTTYSSNYNVAALDIDGDGKVDLSTGYNLIQNNSTPGTIGFLTGVTTNVSSYNSVATADFNKDGKVDIAFTNGSANIVVYENKSSRGTFVNNGNLSTFSPTAVNLAKPNNYGGIVAEDFDGDGYEDLISVNQTAGNYTVYLNAKLYGTISASSFSLQGSYSTSGSQPDGVTAYDFDGDGKTDIAISYYNSAFVSVYLNNSSTGTISFATPVNLTCANKGYNLASQDLDGDGKAEIVVIHQPNPGPGSFTVFKNNSTSGNAAFASGVNFALTRNTQAINIADINSDQRPDILILGYGGSTAPANAIMVFENKIPLPSLSVTNQPASVYSVCDGATPTITTAATGTSNITYQWQIFNSGSGGYVDLTNTAGYSGVTTSSFTINSTGNFGNGTYRCKISGDFVSPIYTNTVSFMVNPIPPTPTTSDVTHCGSGSVILNASGSGTGQYYLWYDQNGLIAGQNSSTYNTPSLSSTTAYLVAITDGACLSTKVNVNAVIAAIPASPSASGVSNCGPASVTLTASGGTNGNYIWYDQNNSIIAGQSNSTFTTPVLSASTTFSVAVTNSTCTSSSVPVAVTINALPAAPSAQGSHACPSTAIVLTASGGTNGNYLWYTAATGGTPIAGEVNSTFSTSSLTATTTYYVSLTNGICESSRTAVVATVDDCTPPTIETESLATQIGGTITIDLKPLIKTANLNLTSIQIVLSPSSGASASVDANGILTIDYKGKEFAGKESITIKACDVNGQCSTQDFTIEVAGDIIVYNGISPNGANPKLILQYIDVLPETKDNTVYIFDRWQNLVWHGSNYNNDGVVFTGQGDGGSELPSGVYFYKIDFASGKKSKTGFISLRRQ